MVVGILQIELAIDDAASLKDKRRVVQSLKDRLHRDHQVSVAEVASQDDCRIAVLGIALAASDVAYANSVLDRILDKARHHRDCHLSNHHKQILTGVEADSI
ncbi:MAG: DUF503 domain-containing protein [Phycisphaeraceae bacterium]|nr:DUF503 domain-containing protein [Phycisphaeraceae bacterium]